MSLLFVLSNEESIENYSEFYYEFFNIIGKFYAKLLFLFYIVCIYLYNFLSVSFYVLFSSYNLSILLTNDLFSFKLLFSLSYKDYIYSSFSFNY